MKIQSRYLLRLLGAFLLVASTHGHAIPILYFDGSTNYGAGSGALSIDAVLTDSVDIAPRPDLTSSTLSIQASFVSSNTSAIVTTGLFGTAPGAPDLSVVDGGPTTLLEGEILDLIITGANGLDFGILSGNFTPTAGSLLADFTNPSGVFALELNLTTPFGAGMFDSNFTGQSDGRVSAEAALPPEAIPIPEPGTLALLTMSLFGLVASQKYFMRTNHN